MKDFYDVWLIMRQHDFKGESLAVAIQKTFAQRKTPFPKQEPFFAAEIYDSNSDRQKLWNAFVAKEEAEAAPKLLSAVAKELERFLAVPVDAVNKNKKFSKNWKASGPWE